MSNDGLGTAIRRRHLAVVNFASSTVPLMCHTHRMGALFFKTALINLTVQSLTVTPNSLARIYTRGVWDLGASTRPLYLMAALLSAQ